MKETVERLNGGALSVNGGVSPPYSFFSLCGCVFVKPGRPLPFERRTLKAPVSEQTATDWLIPVSIRIRRRSHYTREFM